MTMLRFSKAVTLMELIIAVFLLSLVLLVVAGIDAASHRFLFGIDRQSVALLDGSFAIEHMQKWISLARGKKSGFSSEIGIDTPGGSRINFWVDCCDAAGNVLNTPENYGDDTCKRYDVINNQLRFYPDCLDLTRYEVLTSRVALMTPALVPLFPDTTVLDITLETRYRPTELADQDNPTVILETRISPRSRSVN